MKSFIILGVLVGMAVFAVVGIALAAHTAPTGLTKTTADNDATPTFTWAAPVDTVGVVASYEIQIDSEGFVNIGNTTTYTRVAVLADGNHTFSVRARDTSGNVGLTASLLFNVETVNPTVGAITPIAATATVPLTLSATYSDSRGIASCSFFVDGVNRASMTLSGSISGTATVAHTFMFAGNYSAQARCTDTAGNTGAGAVVTVQVASAPADNSAPTTPTGFMRLGLATDTTPSFSWNASSDNMGVAAYEVQIDGGTFMNAGNVLSFTSGLLAVGSHTISVRARDAGGNVSGVASLSFTVAALVSPSPDPTRPPFTVEQMQVDAALTATGNFEALRTALGVVQCEFSEGTGLARVDTVFGTIANESVRARTAAFAACGTKTTRHLGAGERLGAVNSYRAAYGRLPVSAAEWTDVMKLGNGRFPGETSVSAENAAKARFKTIYLRDANMAQAQDQSAVHIMAYGLRPLPRNMNSEVSAIGNFIAIFKIIPVTAIHWDAVRAIAYSGATR